MHLRALLHFLVLSSISALYMPYGPYGHLQTQKMHAQFMKTLTNRALVDSSFKILK